MWADPTKVCLSAALGLRGEATPTNRANRLHLGTERTSHLLRLSHMCAEW